MDVSVSSAICHTEKPWNNLFCGLERNVSWLCRISMLLGRNLYWWSPRQHHTIQSHQAVWIPDSAAFGPSLLLPAPNGKRAQLPGHLLFCCHGEFWDKGANANRDLSFYHGAVRPRVASQCVSWTYEDEVCLLSVERKEPSRSQVEPSSWSSGESYPSPTTQNLPPRQLHFAIWRSLWLAALFNGLLVTQCGKAWRLLMC